jgi:hypothetical protein
MLFVIKIIINNPDILTPYVDDLIKYGIFILIKFLSRTKAFTADGPLIQSLINLSLNPLLNAAISTSKVDEFLQKVIQNIGSNSLLEISKYLPFDF